MICIFCFYNVSSGVQARLAFSKTFKHCNVVTFDGKYWVAHEFDSMGFQTRNVQAHSATSLIRGLKHINSLVALVAVEVYKRPQITWKPFLVRSCNEIDRYITGVNTGFTFNPKNLYNKLLKYAGTDYEILYHWRR